MIFREICLGVALLSIIVAIVLGASKGELSYFQILILFMFLLLIGGVSLGFDKIEKVLKDER